MEFSSTVSFFNTRVVAPTQIFHNPVRSSFAGAYLARDLEAALSASSITISFQNEESHQTVHRPTVLQAEHSLDIEAESGQLTQAQVKAGIIHAIFSKDLVLETLANEKWTRKKGGSISFGLSGLAEFKSLADTLQNTVDCEIKNAPFLEFDSQRLQNAQITFATILLGLDR